MSDPTTNAPLDPGSTTDPTLTNASPTDPSSTDPTTTDPNASDPNLTNPTDPSASTPIDPNAGVNTTPTDPNGSDSRNAGGGGPNVGTQTTGTANFLPSAVSNAPTGQPPSANPNAITGSDTTNGNKLDFDGRSADYRKAIIIASAVSGAVGVILVVVVIFVVYRRRNRRKSGGSNLTFVNSVPKLRPTSDSTWIGTRIKNSPTDSFDESKLETGDRTSHAETVDSDATLADRAGTNTKSIAFSTPSHTPHPSVDNLEIVTERIVPEDPFEVQPRWSIVEARRSVVEQDAPAAAVPRPRKGTPHIRIDSNSTFTGSIVVERGPASGERSPAFPAIPLVTPIEGPMGWRAHIAGVGDDAFVPGPARRDSLVSLSRQSSRASSRNSQNLDQDVISPLKNVVFSTLSTIAKKRRSRGDSIDPFRKSATSMLARHKSNATRNASYSARGAGGVVRRKSSIRLPTTPGGHRKSNAASIVPPMTPRRQSRAAEMDNEQAQVPSPMGMTPVQGLPRTPSTPTTARRSRVVSVVSQTDSGAFAPRTPRTAAHPLPQTPRTASMREPRTPRTPGGRNRMPRAPVPRTPTSLDDAHWEQIPLPEPPTSSRPRPLPPTPKTPKTPRTARAELRLSQVSRALSEVSGESPV